MLYLYNISYLNTAKDFCSCSDHFTFSSNALPPPIYVNSHYLITFPHYLNRKLPGSITFHTQTELYINVTGLYKVEQYAMRIKEFK